MRREPTAITLHEGDAPLHWVEQILGTFQPRSINRVETHLAGAVLERRLLGMNIERRAANAGAVQTGRQAGDIRTAQCAYHVTAAPSRSVIERCKDNLVEGKLPVLLVPRSKVERAKGLAQAEGVEQRVSVFGIEDFIAHNIVEMADEREVTHLQVLHDVLVAYNQRIEDTETDQSLRIEALNAPSVPRSQPNESG